MSMKIWQVQLASTHAPYTHVDLKRSRDHAADYIVVMVNLEKLIPFVERDQLAIRPVTEWDPAKREGIQLFLDPQNGPCEMPVVGCSNRPRKHSTPFGLFHTIVYEPVVGFANGRHRTRYMHYAGATAIPVEVHKSEAGMLRENCGM